MSSNTSLPVDKELSPKIAVFGVGGGGVNAVNNMVSANLEGVDFFVANTDAQALDNSLAANKIKFGLNSTRGLGAGSDPRLGTIAAEESSEDIIAALEKYNLVFITAGMGGGTGTGGAPVVAKLAKERNILTVGVVTKPFHFEGARRMKIAEDGLEELQKSVDTLIIIPNQNLFRMANEKTTFADAFKMADEVLHAGVKGITDLITKPGLINLDFADIHAVINEKGKAMMGTGEAEGENRAIKASEAAISNPLLDHSSMKGAKGVLINITGGLDMTLFEVDEAANVIKEEVDPNANIIFGSAFDNDLEGKIRVSVVATGIDTQNITSNVEHKAKDILISDINDVVNKSQEYIVNKAFNNSLYSKNSGSTSSYTNKKISYCDQDNNHDTYAGLEQNHISTTPKHSLHFHSERKNDDSVSYYNSQTNVGEKCDHCVGDKKEERGYQGEVKRPKTSSSIFDIPTFLRNKK